MAARIKAASKLEKVKDPEVLPPSDEKLVKEAVAFIGKTLGETVVKGTIEVGDYVLEKFFGNDPEQVRSKNPGKDASFRSLVEACETPELPISKSWLHNAVGMAVMRRELPAGSSFRLLPPSHQTALLPLREANKVEKLAERAVKKRLSVRELREFVGEERAKSPRTDKRGRSPKPLIVKTLDRSLRLFTLESGRKSFTKAQVKELDEDQKKAALQSAEDLIESLKKLVAQLGEK